MTLTTLYNNKHPEYNKHQVTYESVTKYLHPGRKTVVVALDDQGYLRVQPKKYEKSPLWKRALRTASYATIIMPCIAKGIEISLSRTCHINKIHKFAENGMWLLHCLNRRTDLINVHIKSRLVAAYLEGGAKIDLINLQLSDDTVEQIFSLISRFFPDVKELKLDSNSLRTIPSFKNRFPKLEEVSLSHNSISDISQIDKLPPQIQLIDLNDNPIDEIIDRANLRSDLCILYTQPATNPALSGRYIAPQPTMFVAFASGNTAPQSIIRPTLMDNMTRLPPHLQHSIPEGLDLHPTNVRLSCTLEELVEGLQRGANLELSNTLIECLTVDEKDKLHKWLTSYIKTSNFKHNKQNASILMCNILKTVESSAEFREIFFMQSALHENECGDHTSMWLNEVFLAWKLTTLESENAPLREKIEILVGTSKTLALRKALQKRFKFMDESSEVFLYYETLLKDRLGLITPSDQPLYSIGKQADIDIEDLVAEVEKTQWKELTDLPQCKTHIESHRFFRLIWANMQRDLSAKMTLLDKNKNSMDDAAYNSQALALMNEQAVAFVTVVKEFVLGTLE